MGPLNVVQRYVFGGMSLVLILLAIWAVRIDGLRGKHLAVVTETLGHVQKGGYSKAKEANLAATVQAILSDRDKIRAERDTARQLVDIQSASIDQLQKEREAAMQEAAANQRLAREAAKQRDIWIARAKSASTRTERRSAEQEVQECQQVLDTLYSSGF